MSNRLRPALLAASLFVAVAAPALAQVGPGSTVLNLYPHYPTYGATVVALTPAASATDIFTITGSATKGIFIHEIGCTGTSTAAASQQVSLLLRSTADTLGTSTAPAAVPFSSTDPASTAVVAAYTANPTVGTAVGSVTSGLLQTVAPASAGANGFLYVNSVTNNQKTLALNGAAQQLAVSLGGVSAAVGTSLTCHVIWTEH